MDIQGYPETDEEEKDEVYKRLTERMSVEQICAELLLPYSRVMELKRHFAGEYPFF